MPNIKSAALWDPNKVKKNIFTAMNKGDLALVFSPA